MRRILLSVLLLGACLHTSAQTTYYVDAARPDNNGAGTSWATAKRDLQIAINGASSNDQVWVKAGTYLPTHDPFGSTAPANNRDKTFLLKNGVKVYGGFAGTETQLGQRNWRTNLTILSGDLGTINVLTDNAYHVVISVGLTAATILDGVTITKGYATSVNTSSITVNTKVIRRHTAGGIYNGNSATTFTNCTITGNTADCTDGNGDGIGAGMINDNCTSAFTNCFIDGNSFLSNGLSFSVFGAGMYITGGSNTITNCVFANNSSGGGNFFGGSQGGALYLHITTTSIINCIFYNNSAMNGAGMAVGGANNIPTVTNCTFANNTSWYAGTGYSGFSKGTYRNCIFWNNRPTSNPVAGRNEILSSETNVANQPTFINCIVKDTAGSPMSVMNTIMSNCINLNPQFINYTDGDGADNIFMTADDGIRLPCGSPAINAGSGSTPTVDILGLPRTGTLDIGAYEGGYGATALNSIPAANTTIQLPQNTSGTTHYSDCSSKLLEIQSGGAYTLSGSVTAKVWVEASQPSGYVKRHYEITPQLNAATATARITLYFTQQEFNDFNAANAIKLPTGPADATGISNIKVEKRSGTSNSGTGFPSSYTGTRQTISAAALSSTWNATASRWEISFDVAGFSGFFLKTVAEPLPLHLLSFTGRNAGSCNLLQWETANEANTRDFEIEKSTNGSTFNAIATKQAAGSGNNAYQAEDCLVSTGKSYYRLKMNDNNGEYTYSQVVTINSKEATSANIYPNPAKDHLVISSGNADLVNTPVRITDLNGRTVALEMINTLPYQLKTSHLQAGFYFLHLQDGKVTGFVKQQ